jgi:hypothetical protein
VGSEPQTLIKPAGKLVDLLCSGPFDFERTPTIVQTSVRNQPALAVQLPIPFLQVEIAEESL